MSMFGDLNPGSINIEPGYVCFALGKMKRRREPGISEPNNSDPHINFYHPDSGCSLRDNVVTVNRRYQVPERGQLASIATTQQTLPLASPR